MDTPATGLGSKLSRRGPREDGYGLLVISIKKDEGQGENGQSYDAKKDYRKPPEDAIPQGAA